MMNFEFYNPTRILFGKGKLDRIRDLVPASARVLITYGGGSAVKSGLVAKVKALLGNRQVYEFGGIEPNPRFNTLMKAVGLIRREGIDFLLAVGGGSVIDGTKFIALAVSCKCDPAEILTYGFRPLPPGMVEKAMPFGTVLTLPASGSEMNSGAVISHEHGKYPVLSTLTYPVFSVLDPEITFTLPAIQVANGIIDAFVHTTEQYLTYPVDARLQDRMAEGILQTLIEIGEITVKDPCNYDARANLVWCATLALNGLIGTGVPQDWATHMMGHELTAMFGIDHGQSLAIILPSLLEIRREQKRAKLLQYAERVWHIETGSEEEKIGLAIKKTRQFFESLGVKTRLSEHNVEPGSITLLMDRLKAHGLTSLSETGDQTLEISRRILENAI
jgi:NADP-dependent alcohol dehydrogenase